MDAERMTYIVAQLGARMHYAVPRVLYAAGHLEHFYTDVCATKSWPSLLRLIPGTLPSAELKRLLGRVPEGVPRQRITAFTSFGLWYYHKRAAARSQSEASAVQLWGDKTFCELVLRRGFGAASGVYAFNGAALELLRAARAEGRRATVEQTIAARPVETRLLRREQQKFPDWQEPLPEDAWADAAEARERAEWEAADTIICGSEFVRDSISACGGPAERCRIVPYGVDTWRFAIVPRRPHGGPLRVLTVGQIGLRKGSPYVLEAARRLRGRAVFRMVGPVNVLPATVTELTRTLELVGPVPRTKIHKHFAWADIFLLPSLCEGSATAVYEALAAHLPVICTPNTGSVVCHGEDGIIVPIGEADPIVDAVIRLAYDNRVYLEMALRAGQRAAEFGIEAYGRRLAAALGLERPVAASFSKPIIST